MMMPPEAPSPVTASSVVGAHAAKGVAYQGGDHGAAHAGVAAYHHEALAVGVGVEQELGVGGREAHHVETGEVIALLAADGATDARDGFY